MMGNTTLREIREALAVAKAGKAVPSSPTNIVEELEALSQMLALESSGPPTTEPKSDDSPDGPTAPDTTESVR